jgi:peptidyl-tRNA hydrolase
MTNPFEEMAADKDPICLYIVVREDLNMSVGKMCVQVGHAVDKVILNYTDMLIDHIIAHTPAEGEVSIPATKRNDFADINAIFIQWRNTGRRKITLIADRKEWIKLKAEFGTSAFIVVDAGLTELEPGTETVMGFLPMRKSNRPKILKRLQALK